MQTYALERQDLSCTYLAHHELESVLIIIIIYYYYMQPSAGLTLETCSAYKVKQHLATLSYVHSFVCSVVHLFVHSFVHHVCLWVRSISEVLLGSQNPDRGMC